MKARFIITSLFLLSNAVAFSQTTNYQVYSVFLVSIARYSSWPEYESNEFKINILGKSKIFDELTKTMHGKMVNGKLIVVKEVETIDEAAQGQIIFLPDGRSSSLAELQKKTDNSSSLIVAEREGLYKKGAGVSFVVLENTSLRFDINSKELEKRKIKMSKNLTDLANSKI